MASSEEQKLDLNFKEDLCAIFGLLFLHPPSVREMVKPWFATFYKMGANILDKQMRNRYTAYMLMQLEVNRFLSKPFDEMPPEHISEPLAKIIETEQYIKFFEKCEEFYLSKKNPSDYDQIEMYQMYPFEFLDRVPPINAGVVAYGACFSREDK